MKESIYSYIEKIKTGSGKVLGYQVIKPKYYFSKRYNKYVAISQHDKPFDGATWAKDINSFSWLFHDVLKRDKKFEDGSACSNWKAAVILRDILKSEGRWLRCNAWFLGVLIYGEVKNIFGLIKNNF
jgi:hypothetical protein